MNLSNKEYRLKLSLARFNAHSICNMHKMSARSLNISPPCEIRDRELLERTSVYFECSISSDNPRLSRSSFATIAEGRKTSR